MARRRRCSDAGYVYHLLNRAVGPAKIFAKPADYAAFEKVLRQAWERTAMRLLAYVLRGAPYGDELWQQQTAQALGLESALRSPGRPLKQKTAKKT